MIQINSLAASPQEELQIAFQRVNLAEEMSLWEKRRVCLIRIAEHAIGIFVRPVYYLSMGIMGKISLYLNLRADRIGPQLRENLERKTSLWMACSLAAPLGELVLMIKAIFGVIHPSVYFKTDELALILPKLVQIAKEAGCEPSLLQKLNHQTIESKLPLFSNRDYYYNQFVKDFSQILNRFSEPNYPKDRIRILLSYLNPEESQETGIEACPAGLGRLLERICSEIDLPHDSYKVLPWLAHQFKIEVLRQMVDIAEANKNSPNPLPWCAAVNKLAFDSMHRNNGMIAFLGKRIRLPKELIERAKNDPFVQPANHLSNEELIQIEAEFKIRFSKSKRLQYFKERINTQPDGTPGFKRFRDHVIQVLAKLRCSEAEDPALEAVRRYTTWDGNDLQTAGRLDLNEEGIHSFLNHCRRIEHSKRFAKFLAI